MTRDNRHNGFSLMEVLFAIVVLTMGMVFVASQFPLGISNAKQVSDAVLTEINNHNATILSEIALKGAILNPQYTLPSYPSFALEYRSQQFTSGRRVHALVTPNVRVKYQDIFLNDPERYSQDLEALFDNVIKTSNGTTYLDYDNDSANTDPIKNAEPRFPFWSQNSIYDPTNGYAKRNDVFLRDIGHMTAPPVTIGDPQVQTLVSNGMAPDMAIFEMATKHRSTSWGALYQCLNPVDDFRDYKSANKFSFFFFTLRNNLPFAQYARQDLDSFNKGVYGVDKSDFDAYLPMPWWIDLGNIAQTPDGRERDRILLRDDLHPNISYQQLLLILREGSVLVDSENGYIYRIKEIQVNESTGLEYLFGGTGSNEFFPAALVLDKPLPRRMFPQQLQTFWTYPPPVIRDRDGNFLGFGDIQPVLNVTDPPVEITF